MTLLEDSIAEAARGNVEAFRFRSEYTAVLDQLWPDEPPVVVKYSQSFFSDGLVGDRSLQLEIEAPTQWSIAFTPSFKKSVSGADRSTQGRVLTALYELSESPTTPHGDTVKPLSGKLKGLWRYRVGDFRLVYEPRQAARTVVVLGFAPRGSVYE